MRISIPPADVRLITGPQDPYKWSYPSEKRYLFQKHLSKHCIQAYKELCAGIKDEENAFIEAIPADSCLSQTSNSMTASDAQFGGICDYVSATKPATSFTARIDQLTSRSAQLELELEQSKSAASQAQILNQGLEATLEAAQSNVNSLQLENERITNECRQLASDAECHRVRASLAYEATKEIYGSIQSVRAKISLSSLKPQDQSMH